ncbi:hypothetical protein CDAR_417281 [Caerostris darwini]|uniref:Uncharacterized protein n=1 Tax=Caerostris darwini TaxID=1538125 RepID=A0AAV4X8Q5_9ARAC|nr:hypothetical protein CDAR_417281 [Caerostris darwini]
MIVIKKPSVTAKLGRGRERGTIYHSLQQNALLLPRFGDDEDSERETFNTFSFALFPLSPPAPPHLLLFFEMDYLFVSHSPTELRKEGRGHHCPPPHKLKISSTPTPSMSSSSANEISSKSSSASENYSLKQDQFKKLTSNTTNVISTSFPLPPPEVSTTTLSLIQDVWRSRFNDSPSNRGRARPIASNVGGLPAQTTAGRHRECSRHSEQPIGRKMTIATQMM